MEIKTFCVLVIAILACIPVAVSSQGNGDDGERIMVRKFIADEHVLIFTSRDDEQYEIRNDTTYTIVLHDIDFLENNLILVEIIRKDIWKQKKVFGFEKCAQDFFDYWVEILTEKDSTIWYDPIEKTYTSRY
jgi:hypothetical protein